MVYIFVCVCVCVCVCVHEHTACEYMVVYTCMHVCIHACLAHSLTLHRVRLRVQHGECLGASLWASSRLLTHFLGAYLPALGAHGKGLRVLELGCGVGLPGIYCALQGCSVTLTDKDEVTGPAPTCVVTLPSLSPLSLRIRSGMGAYTCIHTCVYTYIYCNTLQHPVTYCNALEHTATHCNRCWRLRARM